VLKKEENKEEMRERRKSVLVLCWRGSQMVLVGHQQLVHTISRDACELCTRPLRQALEIEGIVDYTVVNKLYINKLQT
jgi:hypothetical protein